MNTELQYTGYESRKATVKDFRPESIVNDMAHPCDTCPFFDLCAEEGTECAAFRAFTENGKWTNPEGDEVFIIKGKKVGVRGKFRR